MFDEGSSISFIEEAIANKLGLKGQAAPLTLQWYGKRKSTEQSRRVSLSIAAKEEGAISHALKNIRTVRSLNLPLQTFDKSKYGHLKNLPIENYKNAKPVILLGLDYSYLTVAAKFVEAENNKPIAAASKLGWVAFGPIDSQRNEMPHVYHVREAENELGEITQLVEDFFSVENLGVKANNVLLESDADARAKRILVETTRQTENRYEVGLLWREDNVQLPESREMTEQRLLNIEQKMAKNTEFAEKYRNEIEKYIIKGYARLLQPDEASIISPNTWYLPQFGVVNPHKPDKLRVVFDAAATTSDVSLNSALLKGPEHAQSLFGIIAKFRQGIIAVAGDIEEMFSQVQIRPADQDAQRFLWRNGNMTELVQTYAMVSMIFGAICSPCCAEYIKNINAEKYASSMPKGTKAVIENAYVDDLVISFDNIEEARDVIQQAVAINATAGFKLRKFVSNSRGLEIELNKNENATETIFKLERGSNLEKILGMYWNTSDDTLEFHFKFHKVPKDVLEDKRSPTKREMLKIIMSIYDPFGFLANFMIYTKLLLQTTWKLQLQWDEPLPTPLQAQWKAWWNEFKGVKEFSIPRCYSPALAQPDDVQLHIFVDASSNAYAAVAYLRICRDNETSVAFVAAKTRCAPPKGLTIPRLELQAAVLGSRLMTLIVNSHEFNVNRTIFWSDSKTVILSIRSTQRRYKQFVAHRIAEILATTESTQWRWLPTNLNIADDATRAKMPPKFEVNSACTWGPEFLRKDEDCWPHEEPLETKESLPEETLKHLLLLSKPGEILIDFTNFSRYLRLLRTVGWIMRFLHNTKENQRNHGELTAQELAEAEKTICRLVQREVYADEILLLKTGRRLPRSSSLFQLTPYLEDGILRVKGRIDAAYCLPSTARRPIILPQQHALSQLIMNYYHQAKHHHNDHVIMNEMRQKFWVPHIRSLLKRVKKSCPTCIKERATPEVPLMGQLPADRLTPYVRPFSYTGIDYCGPFNIAIGRRREKRWIALFTCLTTRALHLEVAENLSTDAFLICFRNFTNRRGTPVRVRSDNGTNFMGAQRMLKRENRLFDFEVIQQQMAKNNIDWKFNCPADPSAGGCWERLVQCVKRLLSKILKEEAPRLETFRSVMIEAENIINSRPLTDVPVSADEDEPLTPNHFLTGCLNSTQTPGTDEQPTCLRKQWRIAQNLKDRIWKRWTVEYLPQLLQRPKWRQEANPLKTGQLVIICDPAMPRSRWNKGIVTKVFTGKDGQVRAAEVRTSHGHLRRPANKLAALIFGESS